MVDPPLAIEAVWWTKLTMDYSAGGNNTYDNGTARAVPICNCGQILDSIKQCTVWGETAYCEQLGAGPPLKMRLIRKTASPMLII